MSTLAVVDGSLIAEVTKAEDVKVAAPQEPAATDRERQNQPDTQGEKPSLRLVTQETPDNSGTDTSPLLSVPLCLKRSGW